MKSKMLGRGLLLPVFVFALIGMTSSAYASCPAIFVPPQYTISPDNDAAVFLTYSEIDRVETLVLQPEFSGTAAEFGMVMPFPGQPVINEAPENMFDNLLDYTTISFDSVVVFDDSSDLLSEGPPPPAPSVVVIEEKDVGDFKTTVLTATSAVSLVEWLDDNNFEFKNEDQENFEYYVEKGGYYFVAMKVNMNEADIDEDGRVNGTLKPIEFVFESEYPMLPLRIMAHDMDPMSFTLYTLGVFPYYVPGADVLFIDILDKSALSLPLLTSSDVTPDSTGAISLTSWEQQPPITDVTHINPSSLSDEARLGTEFWDRYEPLDKWLVRMDIGFDPRAIETNLILRHIGPVEGIVSDPNLIMRDWEFSPFEIVEKDVRLEYPVSINSYLLPASSGVLHQHARVDLPIAYDVASPRLQSDYGIPPQSIDCKSDRQLMLKPNGYDTACMLESNVLNLLERGWQISTMKADELNRLG